MIVERHRELVINLGNGTFESARISARVSIDTEKDLLTLFNHYGADANVADIADNELTRALAAEVKYWHEITTKNDSFIHLVHADNTAKEQETKNA